MQTYEPGMTIVYDVVSKSTFIHFRGKLHYLLGPFATRREAIAAGEAKCRELGWRPDQTEAA
jgi:hypothetical protein